MSTPWKLSDYLKWFVLLNVGIGGGMIAGHLTDTYSVASIVGTLCGMLAMRFHPAGRKPLTPSRASR